jgi:hypothetical protein
VEEERKELPGCVLVLQAQLDGKELSDGLLDLRELLHRSHADDSHLHEHEFDYV